MLVIQAAKGEGSGHPSEPQPPPFIAQPTNEEPIPTDVSSSHQKTQTSRQALKEVTELPQTSEPIPNVPDEAVYIEWDDKVGRATTTAASLDAAHASDVSTAGAAVTTDGASISTDSPPRVSTTKDISIAETLMYIRRSAAKDKAAGSSKRDAEEELDQGSSKRQKTSENSEPAEESKKKEDDELSQEELQQLMIIVLEEGMNRLYDTCGVHHVSTKDGIDIYMIVEKEYPLSRGVLTQMLAAKLLVEENNEMSRELLRKIFMMAERPRSSVPLSLSVDLNIKYPKSTLAEDSSASVLQALKRSSSIFTLVYVAVQKLRKTLARASVQLVYKWLEENIESIIGINKDDIDEEDDESSTMEPPSRNEAIKAAITLNNFLLSYEKTTPEVLTMLRKIRDEIQGEIDFNKKQKTIESFFKKPS
ncbi:hypothetical protein Tco_1114477 [Tanacetum coccineum]|uniref:Uncharacterized protein n=1 Tax=Tanacetum coccineum TaxID=301880 RepID=A0ABQ5IYW1_9ASTR